MEFIFKPKEMYIKPQYSFREDVFTKPVVQQIIPSI